MSSTAGQATEERESKLRPSRVLLFPWWEDSYSKKVEFFFEGEEGIYGDGRFEGSKELELFDWEWSRPHATIDMTLINDLTAF